MNRNWNLDMLVFTILALFRICRCTNSLVSGEVSLEPEDAGGLNFNVQIDEETEPFLLPQRLLSKRAQVWNGLEVWGFGGTWEQGTNASFHGKFVTNINKVPASLADAKNHVGQSDAFTKAFTHVTSQRNIKQAQRKGIQIYPSDGRDPRFRKLLFLDPNDSNNIKVIYLFDFFLSRRSGQYTNAVVVVDAVKNEVLQASEELVVAENALMKGEGGSILVGQYRYGEREWAGRMLNVTKNKNQCTPQNPAVQVSNVQGNQVPFPPQKCFDTGVVPPFTEPCNPPAPNKDQTDSSFSQVHDALYLTTRYQDILRDMYGDRSLEQCCGPLKVCTSWPDSEIYFFWAIERNAGCPTYYGRSGDRMIEAVAPSIVGHELGHALTFCSSRLEYRCQSGAISEAFSDLSGILLKASLEDFEPDWRFGSEIKRNTGGLKTAIRYMNAPKLDGLSIDHMDDYSCQDVHLANGIYNKAIFNLVSETSWNLLKVFHIFLRANKFYWQEKTGFDQGLCGLMQAARDFDYRAADVAKAFAKVGVFCDCPDGWLKQETVIEYTDAKGNKLTDQNKRTKCYKVMNDRATWAEAKKYCESMNARLVVLQEKSKAMFIEEELPSGKKAAKHWVGATDLNEEGDWKWTDIDEGLKDTRWNSNQPDNLKNLENCMTYSISAGKWGWNDDQCSGKNNFICELA